MRRPALRAFLGVVAAAAGMVAFSPINPLPSLWRPVAGAALGLAALGLAVPPWRDQRHPQWVRNVGLFGWSPGLALVVAGILVFLVERARG